MKIADDEKIENPADVQLLLILSVRPSILYSLPTVILV